MAVETAKNIENEGAIRNGLTKITESIGHCLHLATVVVDGEVASGEVAKLRVQVQGAGLAVAEKLLFDPEPSGVGRGAATFTIQLHEFR